MNMPLQTTNQVKLLLTHFNITPCHNMLCFEQHDNNKLLMEIMSRSGRVDIMYLNINITVHVKT